jgi:hypothetical protein
MEHVLAVYQRPRDPKRPLVCLDEAAKQLVSATRLPMPMTPGRSARHDYEYKRGGTASLFMAFAPLEGKRHVKVTAHRAKADYAQFLSELSDTHFADAEKIVLVQDNLNTHTPASLYATFPPEQARRIADRFEWVYTPKHGSWLNMAEAELSVLSRQCLKERIGTQTDLTRDVAAWVERRNSQKAVASWQFTNDDARVKLRKLYPSV